MKKRKFYINHRLFEYRLDCFDYSKINNKQYFKRNRNKLLLNYYYKKTNNLISTVKHARKLCAGNWFNVLTDIGITKIISEKFDLLDTNKDTVWEAINKNTCKECRCSIPPKRLFCSVKCANSNKSKELSFKENLSKALTNHHKQITPKEKKLRHTKTSKSIKKFNNTLSKQERKQKYTNCAIRYTEFKNLKNRFPKINILCTEVFYYNNRYIPVSCKTCGNEWEITKSTSLNRTVCRICEPYKKHKTQSEIFKHIKTLSSTVKENDRDLIKPLEIDIVIPEYKLCIEFNGLLPHSFGDSKVHYYNNRNVNKEYHLNKTQNCLSKGFDLFHIFENEFLEIKKKNIWFSIIEKRLNKTNEYINTTECEIREIDKIDAMEFVQNNCLDEFNVSDVHFGLFYESELISIMSFCKLNVKNEKKSWEITNFCTKNYKRVDDVYKMLIHNFETLFCPDDLRVSTNRRYDEGKDFVKLGFNFVESTAPNCFYFKVNKNKLYHNDEYKSHKELFNLGYRIIFDCGRNVFIKKYKQ